MFDFLIIMNYKSIIILLLSLICITAGAIDEGKELQPNKLKRLGKKYERNKDIYSAIQYYSSYCDSDTNNLKITYRQVNLSFPVPAGQDCHILFIPVIPFLRGDLSFPSMRSVLQYLFTFN